jgi:SH3-like domain-containing protein
MRKFARVSPGITAMPLILALVCAFAGQVWAQEKPADGASVGVSVGPETNLPIPRYVSLRGSEVNVRRGPGLEYRIDWVFQRPGLPVRVIDEYGHWRRVADSDDAGGWVYHALLTSKRMALVTALNVTIRAEPDDTAPGTARVEQGVVAHLIQCEPDWCQVEAMGTEGWLRKDAVWGVEASEVFGN